MARSSRRRTSAACESRRTYLTLEDAKGLIRAGLDVFAHGIRDKDIDDEGGCHLQGASQPGSHSEPAGSRREERT